ncbi:DUF6660 family protein [Flavisolibacter ginsenosidimutans]|uniref:DUF6660 family protein n=1 Tax=Flavisolibacter ginsenosidimutans TaxID=661481 RepID=UPI003743E78F
MKKALVYLLAFIVLVVSCIPCSDTRASRFDSGAKTVLDQTSGQHNDKDDLCPPFCQCNCCTNVSINHVLASQELAPLFELHQKFPITPSYALQMVAYAIWQPPQIHA